MTDREPGRPATEADWRRQCATGLLGLAAGMGVNLLSGDVGYAGVAAFAAAGAVVTAASWLRRLPPRAPLVQLGSRALLGLAFGSAVVAAVFGAVSRTGAGAATLASVVFVTGAVLVQVDRDRAVYLLAGAAPVGGGVAVVGLAVGVLADGNLLLGMAGLAGGLASFGYGVAVVRRVNCGPAVIVGGLALVCAGAAATADGLVFGLASAAAGVALAGAGVAILIGSKVGRGIALLSLGTAIVVAGLAAGALFRIAIPCGGVGFVALGLAVLRPDKRLQVLAVLILGVAAAGYAAALWRIGSAVGATPVATASVSLLWYGLGLLHSYGITSRARTSLAMLTRDPTT
jgi:hypothetical protein